MGPWINYHHLYYFKVIAEEDSVSKAAQRLRLGQPTLSAQLKQFEEALGVALFERHHKKLVLTEQGKIALGYARSIFTMGAEMYEVLHDRFVPQKISIHIGALDSIAKQVILQMVETAFKVAPCQVSLSEGRADELIRELTAHRIDLLISNFLPTATNAKGLSHRVVSKKVVSVYAAPTFKKLKNSFPRGLVGQPFILPTYDSRLRYDIDHWFKLNEVAPNIVAESQDIAMNKLMAISGLGLIPAAPHAVSRQLQSGELIEVGQLKGIHEELFLISAHRKIENPIAAKLMSQFTV